jgi:hypothetical protein
MSLGLGGIYQFTASTKDNKNATQTATSDPIRISYRPMPTLPPPPATPTPEPVPTEAVEGMLLQTENPNTGLPTEPVAMGSILLYILAGLLGVVLMAVGVLVLLEKRRSGPQGSMMLSGQGGGGGGAIVIDTIMRSPHRDYARAPKNAKAQKKEAKGRGMPPDETIIVPSAPVARETKPEKQETAKRPAKTNSVEKDSKNQRDDPYRRPEPKKEADDAGGDDETLEVMSAAEPEDSNDYLGSIRKGRRDDPEPSEEKKLRSSEDAALLSGSTGQYRLSRATKSSLPGANPKAQDPETFSRRQRALRTQSLAANDDYYYDDDEDPRANRKKRR